MKPLSVKDLLKFSRTVPTVVSTSDTVRTVAGKLIEDRKTREVYVVDEDGRLYGVITVRRLARFVFSSMVPDPSSVTEMLNLLSAETAADLALRKGAFLSEDDSLEHVIDVMLRFEVNEIPVIDEDRMIVGNLNLLEILAAWHDGLLDNGEE